MISRNSIVPSLCPPYPRAPLGALLALLTVVSPCTAQPPPRIPLVSLAERTVSIEYTTGRGPLVVMQAEGVSLPPTGSLELAISTSAPTQFRLYLIPPTGDARFRYVALRAGETRAMRLALDAFDTDLQAERGNVPPGGALLVIDVPGFMRRELKNTLRFGPARITPGAEPLPSEQASVQTTGDRLYDQILGGWTGKSAGCRLGMPLEGRLDSALDQLETLRHGLPRSSWGFGPDDDTTLAVMNLLLLREAGPRLPPEAILESWRSRVSGEYLWKTERRSLELAGKHPPLELGRGPLAESICGRIRCDVWGLVSPGKPRQALDLADKDAPLSNAGIGSDGGRFAAVATALAFDARTPRELLEKTTQALDGLAQAHSGLLRQTLQWHADGLTIAEARRRLESGIFEPIRRRDPDNAWAYALPNDGLVMLALLYGEGKFDETLALAAALGWDADCNAGTAGLLVGVMLGASKLPEAFLEPLHDRLRVAIPGREHWSLRHLAWETRAAVH